MSDEYKKVLLQWAGENLPAGLDVVKVTDVYLDFDKGYGGGCDTCGWGADEDKMSIYISYETSDGEAARHNTSMEMYSFEASMGEVLRALFKIAEETDHG